MKISWERIVYSSLPLVWSMSSTGHDGQIVRKLD